MRQSSYPQDDIHGRLHESQRGERQQSRPRSYPAAASRQSVQAELPLFDTSDEIRFFRSLGIGKAVIEAAARRAAQNATTIECELLTHRDVEPGSYYELLARILGLRHITAISPESVVPNRNADCALRQPRLLTIEVSGRHYHVIAPEARSLDELSAWLRRRPSLVEQIAVTAPSAIREAIWACRARERVQETVRALFESDMTDSARLVITGKQGFMLGLLLATIVVAMVMMPAASIGAAHLMLSLFFFACIMLRVAGLTFFIEPDIPSGDGFKKNRLPIYTVAVALYKEAAVVDQLIEALSCLRWPRSLLDIKLICEEDDQGTLAALARHDLPAEYEIVRVPPMEPRTKPKALHYALSGARGEFLVIYDAEDRPDPSQLLEAYDVFSRSDDQLACLQAPLVISNGERSLFSAVFALEYAGLFRGLLPFLARFGLPLPLGGTSNHFRMDALKACGAWDPYNVTEDADLGMRLFRRGYRGGVLSLSTLEEAPERWAVWMNQRTRWFKGWLQTWLVMMRSPRRLWHEMGPAGFAAFQILIAGMLCSALGHPLLIIFVAVAIAKLAADHFTMALSLHTVLFGIDAWNFVGGYLAFILLARRAMDARERRRVGKRWMFVPVYWVAMSMAAWCALVELIRKPFYWAKTPHEPILHPTRPRHRPASCK